jgi:hypothetical protein
MNKIRNFFHPAGKFSWLILAFLSLFVALLTIFALKGFASRYAQDDYCYGYRFKYLGFWKGQVESYFGNPEYSSNRYSLTLSYGVNELLGGTEAVRFVPLAEIIALVASLSYLLFLLIRSNKKDVISITAASCIAFFTFYLSPNPYQDLYWLSAIHTYLTPVMLTTLILARLLHFSLKQRFTAINMVELGLLGVLAGGFSETTLIWQLSIWMIALLLLILFKGDIPVKLSIRPLVTVVISSLLSLLIMALNPSNSLRGGHYQHAGMLSTLLQSLYFGEEFIRTSLKGTPIPFLFVLSFGVWLRIWYKTKFTFTTKKYLLSLFLTMAIVYVLCVVTMVPYLIVMGVYPGDRVLFPAHFTLVSGLFCFGWLIGGLAITVKPQWQEKLILRSVMALMGLVLLAYLIHTIPKAYDKLPFHFARAYAWDLRQQMILENRANGDMNVVIPQFDSMYGITELKDAGYWINLCAAKYYAVDSITAIDGYKGFSAYSIDK